MEFVFGIRTGWDGIIFAGMSERASCALMYLKSIFLYSNFKKEDGYKKSIELSKKYNLYRQDYCGCEFSKK